MLREIIENSKDIKIIFNDKYYEDRDIIEFFFKILEGSYYSPSYVTADHNLVINDSKKGFWIEINYKEIMSFKDYRFSKLLVPIKPKCNWLTFYRAVDGIFDGKCLNLNISSTTDLYNMLRSKFNDK
ncbi:MAG: hypothetical protein E7345_04915 [Clostridiales bacterium]|nr:hypothetical protein [Clostridiales bacterium]